jgi:hypothetical protein
MIVSHKKMKEIKEKITELFPDDSNTDIFYKFLKDTLKYDENFKYKTEYDKEKYEKYVKPYYEKNKEEINKKRALNNKLNRAKKKLENQNLITT